MFDLLSLSRKATALTVYAGIALCVISTAAEEQHSIDQTLQSTTLTGYVDTSAAWWIGSSPQVAAIPNDAFANATPVAAGVIAPPSLLSQATLEEGEPSQIGQTGSIWYKWIVPGDGAARIGVHPIYPYLTPSAFSITPALSTESIFYPWGGISNGGDSYGFASSSGGSSGFIFHNGNSLLWPSTFSAYRGDTLTSLKRLDTGESLEFWVKAGETVWIALETYPVQTAQNFTIDFTPPPANDSFVAALAVENTSAGLFSGYATGASHEPGEPELGAGFEGGSVWFKYTAATFGYVSVAPGVSSSFFPALPTLPMAVFEGTSLSNLHLVQKSIGGSLSFFGVEGGVYWIAIYGNASGPSSFSVIFNGPQYRLYETTSTDLMPPNFVPHFYGVRGATMLLYKKTMSGWDLVEVEPITNQMTDLLIRPADAVDGKLRVITIEDVIPAPHVEFTQARGTTIANLAGIFGQSCAFSYSTDLVNWSAPQVFTLAGARRPVHFIKDGYPGIFYRITQSIPETSAPKKQIEAAP